jgi:hypothetical protein
VRKKTYFWAHRVENARIGTKARYVGQPSVNVREPVHARHWRDRLIDPYTSDPAPFMSSCAVARGAVGGAMRGLQQTVWASGRAAAD